MTMVFIFAAKISLNLELLLFKCLKNMFFFNPIALRSELVWATPGARSRAETPVSRISRPAGA